MKAVRFHEYGDAGVLRYEDVDLPVPGAGEVRIRVAASAFNPVDDGIRGGYLQGPFPVTLPHTPGIEVSGTVDAIGEGVPATGVDGGERARAGAAAASIGGGEESVAAGAAAVSVAGGEESVAAGAAAAGVASGGEGVAAGAAGAAAAGFAAGDAVIGFLPMTAPGAAAEYVIAPAEVLAAAPAKVPLADAAALPMVGLTAWQALFDDAGLTAGQRVLINGAGGAVGGYAVQLAKHVHAYVIATASPRSAERVRAAGADEVIDHTNNAIAGAVTEPVDVLLNLARIAPEELVALTALVRDGGVVVNTVPTIATPADATRGVRGIGVFVRSDAAQLSHLVELVDRGALRVDVDQRLPLAELPAVHARAAAGELHGKVVLLP